MAPKAPRVEARISSAVPFAWIAVSSLAVVTLALCAAAQTPGATADDALLDQVEVRLVEIDVRVTDGDGERVEGLTEDDFRLLVDGEEREIEYFAAVRDDADADDAGADANPTDGVASEVDTAPDPARLPRLEPAVDAGPRHLVVYVDRRFVQPEELERARMALQRFLHDDVPAGTSVMLAAADDELQTLQRFTTEPALVADALDSLAVPDGRAAWRQKYDLTLKEIHKLHDMGRASRGSVEPRSLSDYKLGIDRDRGEIQDSYREGQDVSGYWLNQGEDVGRTELAAIDPRLSLQMIEDFERTVEPQVQRSVGHLAQTLRAMSGLEGEKALLYVGGALPSNAARTLFEIWQDTYGSLGDQGDAIGHAVRRRGYASGVRSAGMEGSRRFGDPIRLVDQVADVANAADVTIHSLDVSVEGHLGRGQVDVENYRSGADMGGIVSSDTRIGRRPDSGIFVLADRTGGRTEFQRKFEDFFDGVARDLEGRYVLAFTAEVPGPRLSGDGEAREEPTVGEEPAGGGVHEIEIELRGDDRQRKKFRLHHRRGVVVKSLEQETTEQTMSALALDVSVGNPLEIQVAAGEPRAAEEGASTTLPLSVKVPMARLALVPDQQSHAGRLSIYVAVGDLGSGVSMAKSEVPVRIPNRDLLTAFGRTVDYRLEVAAPPGARRVAVTVRDEYRPSDSTVTARVGSLPAAEPSAQGSTEGGL